jgi:hypothetical protein
MAFIKEEFGNKDKRRSSSSQLTAQGSMLNIKDHEDKQAVKRNWGILFLAEIAGNRRA